MAASPAARPETTHPNALRAACDDLLAQLSDFWFGMGLLAIWGLLTLIGVVVDQGKDAAFYATNYAPPLARLVLRLHLDNIYHSPAYIGMVGFIVACMTLATFKRVIPARLPPLRAVRIERIPLNANLVVAADEATVRERVETFFRTRGWLVRRRDLSGTEWTFADRHNWARRGVIVAHIGFVIVAIGTTIYWATGYSGQTAILTGKSVAIPENGTRLRLDRFAYRFDPIKTRSGIVYQPIDYVSDLTVTGRDGVPHRDVLRVNHPLDIDGTLYYQSSYGSAVRFALKKDGKPALSPADPLFEGDGFPLGTSSRTIRYERFAGTLDAKGGVAKDPRPNNPGVLLGIFDGDQEIGQVLLPLHRALSLGDGYRVEATGVTNFSGIQYTHDPGSPFVLAGALVLLAGLVISFHFVPARFHVRIESATGGTAVAIAATTVKGFEIFEEQFGALVGELRGAVGST
ncbi:MAG: cytochrome c biogenesis protein ResB [Candidatus Eremiobacteraeota bacterium]|nr:cytochrome c biogenesis protein ResB [Candidatus Eremiobacteraeota bacterium]